MTIFLTALTSSFAVFCVYVLSYGLWLRYYAWSSHGDNATLDASGIYRPVFHLANDGPKWISKPYNLYLKWVISVGFR